MHPYDIHIKIKYKYRYSYIRFKHIRIQITRLFRHPDPPWLQSWALAAGGLERRARQPCRGLVVNLNRCLRLRAAAGSG